MNYFDVQNAKRYIIVELTVKELIGLSIRKYVGKMGLLRKKMFKKLKSRILIINRM